MFEVQVAVKTMIKESRYLQKISVQLYSYLNL